MSILEALGQLAKSERLVADPDYEDRPVAYLVPVTSEGKILPLRSTKRTPESGAKKDPKMIARTMPVPRQSGRTSGDRAFFLCDKSEYVLGLLPDMPGGAERSPEKLATRAALFREQVADCVRATDDEGVRAVLRALEDVAAGRQRVTLPDDCASNDLFAFVYTLDGDALVHERPGVRRYWGSLRAQVEDDDGKRFQCAVTGAEMGAPGLFPKVKYVPGGTTSGVSLVSFNAPAFESHGLSSNENAPISRAAAEAAATALERLVHPAPEYGGRKLQPRNIRIGDATIVGFWASDQRADGLLDVLSMMLDAPDPSVVGDLYRSMWYGRPVDVGDAGQFYALTLSGAQGRMIVRDWFETNVQEVAKSLARHFADLMIVRNTPVPKGSELPPQLPLRALLASLAPFGKREEISAPLATALVDAALRGTTYPFSLLQRALERARAEIGKDGWADLERRDARAALIKGVLERRRRSGIATNPYPELRPEMDATNTTQGYLLGRLMAVLERLQQLSLGDPNASVVDRYFGAASATPRAVFPRLLRNARHHARKAKDNDATVGTARWLDRTIDEIAAQLAPGQGPFPEYRGAAFDARHDAFPAYLDLEQQGLFILGYHQQRHALWSKRTERAQPPGAEPESESVATI